MKEYLKTAIEEQKLPSDFSSTIERWYFPVAEAIAKRAQSLARGGTEVLGIQGSQGSGKSTMASFLKLILKNEYRLTVAVLSLDDFYHTRAERLRLSQHVHPLLATRGVPGTHDVELALTTLHALSSQRGNEMQKVPRFNKAIDDRMNESEWDTVTGNVDVVIFEGWCVGVSAQDESDLEVPINQLEREEDPEGVWRRFVNRKLKEEYSLLFGNLTSLLVLQAPSFDIVFEWRLLQEKKLAAKVGSQKQKDSCIQSANQLRRFISHYERLTRRCLSKLPQEANWVLLLDSAHKIVAGTVD